MFCKCGIGWLVGWWPICLLLAHQSANSLKSQQKCIIWFWWVELWLRFNIKGFKGIYCHRCTHIYVSDLFFKPSHSLSPTIKKCSKIATASPIDTMEIVIIKSTNKILITIVIMVNGCPSCWVFPWRLSAIWGALFSISRFGVKLFPLPISSSPPYTIVNIRDEIGRQESPKKIGGGTLFPHSPLCTQKIWQNFPPWITQ